MSSKAVTAYYATLIALGLLMIVIIGSIAVDLWRLPPCTTTLAKDVCGVNDWSLAGIVTGILGVAATVLAFLGAFAVAVWWRELDKKVEKRVNELTEERLKLISANLQTLLESYADQRLKALEGRVQERFAEVDEANNQLWEKSRTLQKYIDGQDRILLEGVISQYPWMLEDWAKEWTDKAPASHIAFYMTIRYSRVIDAILTDPAQQLHLKQIGAPFTDPQEYLQCAARWSSQIVDLSQGSVAKVALAERQKSIDVWKAQQNSSKNQSSQ